MASIHHFSVRKSALLYLVFFLFASLLVSTLSHSHPQRRRRLLSSDIEEQLQSKKKTTSAPKNQTKTITPKSTNLTKSPSLSTPPSKKLNSTSKSLNSSKPITPTAQKSLNSSKPTTPKNKTQSVIITKTEKKPKAPNTPEPIKIQSSSKPKLQTPQKIQKTQKPIKPKPIEYEDEDNLVSEFRYLPSKFQQTLLPDLEKISITSRAYINQANREISEGFRPLVGKQYASHIASVVSCIFIFVPLLLVSLIVNRIKAHFSLQKILIFIQAYLSIYFSILSFASLATGLEPLKFFFTSSESSYICLQVLQTLGYVMYLLLLLMYFVLVFSTETGFWVKVLGLVQTFVGFAIGLHYYVAVFHRAVLHQPPKTNWKIHGIYAMCFLVICLLANAERRKKAYLEDGGEEGKKS